MASEASQTPPAALNEVSATKKRRMNPARRKAAAKSKGDTDPTDNPEVSVATRDDATAPKQSSKTTDQSNKQTALQSKSKSPPTLSRTTTEPVQTAISKPSQALSKTTSNKPALSRSTTAPVQSTNTKSTLALTPAALVTGGLVGCCAGAAILLGVGIWYDFAGAQSAILAAKAAKICVDNLTEEVITNLKAGTYSADEALDMLRRTTLAYASTIPEGAGFVERVFREIGMIRKQRGRDVDLVLKQAYIEIEKAGRRGASAAEMRGVVVGQLDSLSKFAGLATRDLVTRNPGLRPYRDGAMKAIQGPPERKETTVRVNMAVRQKQAVTTNR